MPPFDETAGTPSSTALTTESSSNLALPRLLCLHGGGVNAEIFRIQCRTLLPLITPHFRPVWVDAPYLCPPHADVVHVYGDKGPFRRWLRWSTSHPEVDAETLVDEISYNIRRAMEEDDREGGTGEYVGIMGFSQGAKLAASMLVEQQTREAELGKGKGVGTCGIQGIHWRFGILIAGRAPLVALDPKRQFSRALVSPDGLSEGFPPSKDIDDQAKVHLPTFHIHGLEDPGLGLHRKLINDYCKTGTAKLMEWQGGHRIPLKTPDVAKTAYGIFNLAREAGMTLDL